MFECTASKTVFYAECARKQYLYRKSINPFDARSKSQLTKIHTHTKTINN